MANENYIEDLKRRLAEHRTTKKNSSSHIEEAYETGCINILETAIQKYGENSFEEWLHKAE